jgi:hypothetical protein
LTRSEVANAGNDSQAVSCVKGFGEQVGGNRREATVAVTDRPFLPIDTVPLGYRFRHSHGGTGCGSAHNPFLSSRASLSNFPAPYLSAHTCDTTSTNRLLPTRD